MKQPRSEDPWCIRLVGSRMPWGSKADRPADVGEELCAAMLARENIIEDANYQKIAPNQFVVEIGIENYARNFHLLQTQILQQWNEKLLTNLLTANSRQGRQEYRLASPLKVEIHPVADLGIDQVRIYCRVHVGEGIEPHHAGLVALTACLEILPGGRRLMLHPGIMTIGRDTGCDICLDAPAIQQNKLVSSQHAYLSCKAESCRLFDGAPNGNPSLNGTYVNLKRVASGGIELRNDDMILLATLDPGHPDPDSPGVASLRFHQECK